MTVTIPNRDRWEQEVDFLEDDQIMIVGDIGGTPLALLGYSKEEQEPVLARCPTGDPATGLRGPCYMHQLMTSQDQLRIKLPNG